VSTPDGSETRVRIRRAPKFSMFLIVGGAAGVIVAFIVTAAFPVDDTVSFGQAFGYLAIYGVTAGVLVGAVIAVILDRVLGRRAKTVSATVDRLQPIEEDDDQPS
jgi:ethanolamine transporter EutH